VGTLINLTGDDLLVPALGRTVAPDQPVEAPDELLRGFIGQDDTWSVQLDGIGDEPDTGDQDEQGEQDDTTGGDSLPATEGE
jgi:hypothetical protein